MREQTIANAESQLGYHEQGTNINKFSEWLGGFDAAWCAAFVSWCAYMAGVRFPGSTYGDKGWAYVPTIAAFFKNAGRFTSKPARGMWGIINNEVHVVLVESVDGNSVYTIEGNESDQVMHRVRPLSNFEGFADIDYGDGSPPQPPEDVPPFRGSVRRGSRGQIVRQVQQRLADRGWGITVDGDFGIRTDTAVRAFQTEKHLLRDGIVGQATWRALWLLPT